MSVISGDGEAEFGIPQEEEVRPRARIRAESSVDAKREQDVELLVDMLEQHRLGLTRYFKDIIECAPLSDLVVDDFAQDILLHIWQSDLAFDWRACSLNDLVQVGRGMVVDKLLQKLSLNYVKSFKDNRQERAALALLMAKTRDAFMDLSLDPYFDADWIDILQREAAQIFRREFHFYAERAENLVVTQICDGKVRKVQVSSSKDALDDESGALCSTRKVEAIFMALQTAQANQEFRYCIYQQMRSFHQKFPDIWKVISFRIWDPVSTKKGAAEEGKNQSTYRQHCSARLSGMLEHLRVCVPLLKENHHE